MRQLFLRLFCLRRGDLLAIAFVIVLVGGFLVLASTGYWGFVLPNFGFGPGWNCTYVATGEPACVKDIPRPSKPN